MMQITPTVKQLLIINVIFFVGSFFVPEANNLLSLHYPSSPGFEPWQVVTHMFMHANIMHIAFNMLALFSFGSALEHFWGGKKFLFFYISCGLGAALLQLGINYLEVQHGIASLVGQGFTEQEIMAVLNGKNNQQLIELINVGHQDLIGAYLGTMLGASGAVYGLLVAFAFMFPNAELAMLFIPIPIKAKYFVPGMLCIDLFLGLKGQSIFGGGSTGIAHFAHIGGALIGFIMMWYWKKNQFGGNRWNRDFVNWNTEFLGTVCLR